jgi:hypothetical protein
MLGIYYVAGTLDKPTQASTGQAGPKRKSAIDERSGSHHRPDRGQHVQGMSWWRSGDGTLRPRPNPSQVE